MSLKYAKKICSYLTAQENYNFYLATFKDSEILRRILNLHLGASSPLVTGIDLLTSMSAAVDRFNPERISFSRCKEMYQVSLAYQILHKI